MMHSKPMPDVGDRYPARGQGGGQDSAARRSTPEYLAIATVLAPWGLRGDVKVLIETDFPDRFALLTRVYLGPKHRPYDLERFRLHGKGCALLKLRNCDDRDAAEPLRGMAVQIPLAEAMPLEPGEYYVHQIEGLTVWTEEGDSLGTVSEVVFTGSNQVYVTRGPRGQVLIPALKDVVLKVDLEAGRMIVRLPPGLLDSDV